MARLNHSRYLGSERLRSQREYEREKSMPTAKQKKFFRSLVAKCKENGIDCNTGRTRTRGEYALAIDKLLEMLQESGVDVKGNGKNSALVLTHKPDARNNEYITTERIVVEPAKTEGWNKK